MGVTRDATEPHAAFAAPPGFPPVSVRAVLESARGIRSPLVLIDGPSGAGKSTLADAVRASWPGWTPALVRLDDVYRGWSGLERAGAELARTLVRPLARDGVGRWHRWDWLHARPGKLEWQRPGAPLIVEGCGAFEAGSAASDAIRVWVDAAEGVRRQRALARDRGAYDPFWNMWERQWRHYVHRASPQRHADLHLWATGEVARDVQQPAPRVAVHAVARGIT